MSRRSIIIPAVAGVVVSLALISPMRASTLTVISQPIAAYTSSTNLIDISGLSGSIGSIKGGGVTVKFSTPMEVLKVGVAGGWGTWNSPPATESSTPTVLYSNGSNNEVMSFSTPVSTFGFEAQPDFSDTEQMKATFFNASDAVLGNVTLNVSGNAGALLFAVSSSAADIARVNLTDLGRAGTGCPTCDFAIANVRVATVPEPASFFLVGIALVALVSLRFSRAIPRTEPRLVARPQGIGSFRHF